MAEAGRYESTTEWTIPAPPERVWTELMDPERWPQVWPGEVQAALSSGLAVYLARTAKAQVRRHKAETIYCFCLLPFAFCLLPFAFCLEPGSRT